MQTDLNAEFSAIYDVMKNDAAERNQSYALPSSIRQMTTQEMADWKTYKYVVGGTR